MITKYSPLVDGQGLMAFRNDPHQLVAVLEGVAADGVDRGWDANLLYALAALAHLLGDGPQTLGQGEHFQVVAIAESDAPYAVCLRGQLDALYCRLIE